MEHDYSFSCERERVFLLCNSVLMEKFFSYLLENMQIIGVNPYAFYFNIFKQVIILIFCGKYADIQG